MAQWREHSPSNVARVRFLECSYSVVRELRVLSSGYSRLTFSPKTNISKLQFDLDSSPN